jgi:hypothetical protein
MTSTPIKDVKKNLVSAPAEEDPFQEEFLAAGAICDHCDNSACGSLSWETDWSPAQCEDFGAHFRTNTRVATASIISPSSDKGRPERLGLCRTCNKSMNCSTAKPMSGVWDCDDYG